MNIMTIALAAMALAFCTQPKEQPLGAADAGRADAKSADAETTPPDASSAAACDAWCGVRAPKEETEGWCPIGGFGEEAPDCIQACEELAQTAPPAPLEHCVAENALCFLTMEQCIIGAEHLAKCSSWCEYRTTEHANEGFCEPFLLDAPEATCVNVCVRALQEELPSVSVEECVRNNPLCFVDLAGCA